MPIRPISYALQEVVGMYLMQRKPEAWEQARNTPELVRCPEEGCRANACNAK